MQILFFIPSENYSKVKNRVYEDDLVSRQSINFRESKALDMEKDGYYLEIVGSEEAVKKAKELIADLGEEVTGEEKEKVLDTIAKQEESAAEGFGSIFG